MSSLQSVHHQGNSGITNEGEKLSLMDRTPKLSSRGLTFLLVLMAAVPTITVFVLFYLMPDVYEGQLDANIKLINVPPDSYYEMPLEQRPEIESARVLVENTGDFDWTNFYIRVNHYYQTFDSDAIPAGESREYRLNRFIAKIGAVLDIRHVKIESIEIYARVPSGARYTFEQEY